MTWYISDISFLFFSVVVYWNNTYSHELSPENYLVTWKASAILGKLSTAENQGLGDLDSPLVEKI